MAFYRPVLEHYAALNNKISVAIRKSPSQKTFAFGVAIGPEVQRMLRLKSGDRIEVLWGTDEDAGSIIIQRAEGAQGGFLRYRGKKSSPSLSTNLGNMPRLPISGPERTKWTLDIKIRPSIRLDWTPYPETGIARAAKVALPREWFTIEAGALPFRTYGGKAA